VDSCKASKIVFSWVVSRKVGSIRPDNPPVLRGAGPDMEVTSGALTPDRDALKSRGHGPYSVQCRHCRAD
jgi:hypothetical protein